MRFPHIAGALHAILLARVASRRPPDFIVGADSEGGPYLLRWYLTPWRRLQTRMRSRADWLPSRWNRAIARAIGYLPNLYLHQFLRDDDDRALHDHPSWAASFMLAGAYTEHTIADGGVHHRRVIEAGSLRFLPTRHTHRIELLPYWLTDDDDYPPPGADANARTPCWTLFLFGPTIRDWGFHCPDAGWIHWRDFTAAGKPGEVGPGCDQ